MTRRAVLGSIMATALMIPAVLAAQTFVEKRPVATSLSVTLNPAGVQPARLKYTSSTQTLDAQAESVTMTWDAGGLIAEMTAGEYSSTTGNWATAGKDGFKTLVIRFAPSGELISAKAVK